MDMNYILAREQVSLLRAAAAPHPSARYAHREMARQYGLLLAGSAFPHRVCEEPPEATPTGRVDDRDGEALGEWANEGGALP